MKITKTYIVNQRTSDGYDASGKAVKDIFQIIDRIQSEIIPCIPKKYPYFLKIFDLPLMIIYLLIKSRKGDSVLYIFPDNLIRIKCLSIIKFIKRINIICLINDINSIRFDSSDDIKNNKIINKEMNVINKADNIIAPNKNSILQLKKFGITKNIVCTGIWDYLIKNEIQIKCELKRKKIIFEGLPNVWNIVFAGNLKKSGFIYKLDQIKNTSINFHLYGLANNEDFSKNSFYHGVVSSEKIPNDIANYHFGLVWDGDDVTSCSGGLGEYLKFNNSHKCGLYLASGIPVIIWSQSGMSHFINENNCGFSVNNLNEIYPILNSMTTDKYQMLSYNAIKVSKFISTGFYLEKSLKEVIDIPQ